MIIDDDAVVSSPVWKEDGFLSSKLMGNGKEMNMTLKNKSDVLKFYMFYTGSHVPEQAIGSYQTLTCSTRSYIV